MSVGPIIGEMKFDLVEMVSFLDFSIAYPVPQRSFAQCFQHPWVTPACRNHHHGSYKRECSIISFPVTSGGLSAAPEAFWCHVSGMEELHSPVLLKDSGDLEWLEQSSELGFFMSVGNVCLHVRMSKQQGWKVHRLHQLLGWPPLACEFSAGAQGCLDSALMKHSHFHAACRVPIPQLIDRHSYRPNRSWLVLCLNQKKVGFGHFILFFSLGRRDSKQISSVVLVMGLGR